MQSKKWRNLTILNGILLLAALAFFLIRDNQYFRAYEYFGESAYNSQYWLHPQNNWIERVSYKDSGRGFIQDFRPQEDGSYTLQLALGDISRTLTLNSRDIFLKINGAETTQVDLSIFILSLNKDIQISYECAGLSLETIACTYFVNE